MEAEKFTMEEMHKKQAVINFNGTWDLIDKADRTEEDKLNMIHMAHASRYHWGFVGGPKQLATGEWQISRVYALLDIGESALYHGSHCLRICKENDLDGFDLGFAYEAIARAYMVLQNNEMMTEYLNHAFACADKIENAGDREYFLSELNKIDL